MRTARPWKPSPPTAEAGHVRGVGRKEVVPAPPGGGRFVQLCLPFPADTGTGNVTCAPRRAVRYRGRSCVPTCFRSLSHPAGAFLKSSFALCPQEVSQSVPSPV